MNWLALASDNGYGYASYLLARMAAELGQTKDAESLMARASEQGYSTAQLRQAVTHAQAGEHDAAAALLVTAETHLDKVTLHSTAALLAAHRGNDDEANKHLARVRQWLSEYGYNAAIGSDLQAKLNTLLQSGRS